jgi:hypothetical protein
MIVALRMPDFLPFQEPVLSPVKEGSRERGLRVKTAEWQGMTWQR